MPFLRAHVSADLLPTEVEADGARAPLSELGVGAIVPASGAAGLALGAWVLHEGGLAGEQIARRSVAFFLIKRSVNFLVVAVVGTLAAVGLAPTSRRC